MLACVVCRKGREVRLVSIPRAEVPPLDTAPDKHPGLVSRLAGDTTLSILDYNVP